MFLPAAGAGLSFLDTRGGVASAIPLIGMKAGGSMALGALSASWCQQQVSPMLAGGGWGTLGLYMNHLDLVLAFQDPLPIPPSQSNGKTHPHEISFHRIVLRN